MTGRWQVLSRWKQLKNKQINPISTRFATRPLRPLGSFYAICSDRHPIWTDRVFPLEAARVKKAVKKHVQKPNRARWLPFLSERASGSKSSVSPFIARRLHAPRSEAKKAARAAFCPRFLEGRVNRKGPRPGRRTVRSAGDCRGSVGRGFLGAPNSDAGLDSGLGPHGFTPSELRCST
jgi:hypothetical protein